MERGIFIALIFSLLLVSGCSFLPEDQLALSPYIEFEAVVISVTFDESDGYLEGGQIYRAPSDSAVVRIDSIIETGGSFDFDWSSIGIVEGEEVSLGFEYTARPTKIITVVGETTQLGDAVSHQIVPTEISFEKDYFVFRINGNSETETVLFGLQEGSKFKTKLWMGLDPVSKIGEYEVII